MGEYNGVGNGCRNVGNYSGGGGGGSIGGIGSRNMNTVLMMALCWWYQLGQASPGFARLPWASPGRLWGGRSRGGMVGVGVRCAAICSKLDLQT